MAGAMTGDQVLCASAAKDAIEMSSNGTSTGHTESQSGGSSDSGRAAMSRRESSVEPGTGRTGTVMRPSNHRAVTSAAASGMIQNTTPAIIAMPSGNRSASATTSGPGAGGITPFASDAPAHTPTRSARIRSGVPTASD